MYYSGEVKCINTFLFKVSKHSLLLGNKQLCVCVYRRACMPVHNQCLPAGLRDVNGAERGGGGGRVMICLTSISGCG